MKNAVLLIMLLIFTSCNYTGIKSTLTQMSGKVVILDSLTPIFLGKEMSGKIKIEPKYARLVVYYDSTYCQSCRINRLDEWNGIISLEKKYDYNFDVILYSLLLVINIILYVDHLQLIDSIILYGLTRMDF